MLDKLGSPILYVPAGLCSITDGGDVTGGGGVAAEAQDSFQANVWATENLVSGFGKTKVVTLTDLPAGAKELQGPLAYISGEQQLNGKFLYTPFADDGSLVTKDQFDQVIAYHAVTAAFRHYETLGYNVKKMIAERLPVYIKVNGVDDINAWFDPSATPKKVAGDFHLTFGKGLGSIHGQWHLASDGGIVLHELQHLVDITLNPSLGYMYAKDASAILEGTADMGSASFYDDPEVGEDFSANLGYLYGQDRALRTVDQLLKYGDVSSEEHDRGQIYGGFWWGVKKDLMTNFGLSSRAAADLAHGISIQHITSYLTGRPLPKDMLDASILGARAYLGGRGITDISPDKIAEIMIAQATLRGMPIGDYKAPKANPLVTDGELAKLMLGLQDKGFVLPLEYSTRGTFVGRDYYQQHLLANGLKIRIIGAGLAVFADQNGEQVSYSALDVDPNVKVDTTMNLGPRAALNRAVKNIFSDLANVEQELNRLGVNPESPSATPTTAEANRLRNRWRRLQMASAKTKIDVDPWDFAELVVLPADARRIPSADPSEMFWRLPLAFERVYVSAKTGEVVTASHPMW